MSSWKNPVAEAVGSFLLTLSVSVSYFGVFKIPGTYYSAYPIASFIIVFMMMTGFISGAKFNPAVTIGHMVSHTLSVETDKGELLDNFLYIIIQMTAAIPGAFLGSAINRQTMYFDLPDTSNASDAFFAELIYSILIVGVALMIGKLNDSIIIGTAGLGSAYFGGIFAVGLISGGCFNPALALAVNLAHYSAHGDHMGNIWIYLIAPLLGGAIGGVLNTVFLAELKSQKSKIEPS